MSDNLFDIPSSQPPELEQARKRFAKAQEAYDAAMESDDAFDSFGEAAYPDQVTELRLARRSLAACEARAFKR